MKNIDSLAARICTFIILVIVIYPTAIAAQSKNTSTMKTMEIESTDGLKLKADIYETSDKNSPIILLFHQARYSRGEYLEIAPKLKAKGFMCIAVDQRSGDIINSVQNETVLQAEKKGLGTKYVDAYPDLKATLEYTIAKYPNRKIIAWGSSYSSSLIFILASEYKQNITALLAFSPGEYFKFNNKSISEYAKDIKCPVFITSSKDEYEQWENIYLAIPSKNKESFIPETPGKHGSKALWINNDDNGAYWEAVSRFINGI